MSAIVATDYATQQRLEDLDRRLKRIEEDNQRKQKDDLEEANRKSVFWTHMMQFFVVTVLILEFVWIVSLRLGR